MELALFCFVTSLAVIPSADGAVAGSRLVRGYLVMVLAQPGVIVIVTQIQLYFYLR